MQIPAGLWGYILEYSIDPIPPGAVCKNSAIIAVPSAKCASIGLGKLVTKNYLADEALSKPAGKSKSSLLDTVRDCNQPRNCHVQDYHPWTSGQLTSWPNWSNLRKAISKIYIQLYALYRCELDGEMWKVGRKKERISKE
jgi:hypothetical protein